MYKIVRHFMNGDRELIAGDLTLEEVQSHCKDPESSSRTCTTYEGRTLTEERGQWFDGYDEE
jgi:hypothetical protein